MAQKEDVYFEATVDVNIVAIAVSKNPAQGEALAIIEKILKGQINALIPATVILGAYMVLVKIYRVKRDQAEYALSQLAKSQNINWFETVKIDSIEEILSIASKNNIEGWDAYLISTMKEKKIQTIYTTDSHFSKFSDITTVNPISGEKWTEFCEWQKKYLKT